MKTKTHSVNIAVLKNQLSKHLKLVRKGDRIIVMDRKEPIAEIIPIDRKKLDPYEQMVKEGLIRPPLTKPKEIVFSPMKEKIPREVWMEALNWVRSDRFQK